MRFGSKDMIRNEKQSGLTVFARISRPVKEGPSSRAIGPQEPRHEAGGLDLSIRREEYGKSLPSLGRNVRIAV
jgi:hypothetical protein